MTLDIYADIFDDDRVRATSRTLAPLGEPPRTDRKISPHTIEPSHRHRRVHSGMAAACAGEARREEASWRA
jgi:hypothetical protein